MIYVNRRRYSEIQLESTLGLSGYVRWELVKANGELIAGGSMPNVITDEAMAAMRDGANSLTELTDVLWVGRGNSVGTTPPDRGDVSEAIYNPAGGTDDWMIDGLAPTVLAANYYDRCWQTLEGDPYQTWLVDHQQVRLFSTESAAGDEFVHEPVAGYWSLTLSRIIDGLAVDYPGKYRMPAQVSGGSPTYALGDYTEFGLARSGSFDEDVFQCIDAQTGEPFNRHTWIHRLGTTWNRLRFVDDTGTPLTPFDIAGTLLRVWYEIRLTYPSVVNEQIINVDGVNYTCRTRASNVGNVGTWGTLINNLGRWDAATLDGAMVKEDDTMLAIDQAPNDTGAVAASAAAVAGTGDWYNDIRMTWQPGVANFATGIGSMYHFQQTAGGAAGCAIVTTFTPKLPKDNTKKLVVDARYSWARPGID